MIELSFPDELIEELAWLLDDPRREESPGAEDYVSDLIHREISMLRDGTADKKVEA